MSNGPQIGGIIVSGETIRSIPARQYAWAARTGTGPGRAELAVDAGCSAACPPGCFKHT